jgi:tetratricopeptide (TPR) repeat protein
MKRYSWLSVLFSFSMIWPCCPQVNAQALHTPQGRDESVNADLTAARAASKDKHYAEAEALMLKTTAAHPEAILPWIELGLDQLALQKYKDAEFSFKAALGIGPNSPTKGDSADFFGSPENRAVVAPSATHASRSDLNGGTFSSAQKRTPEVQGVAYSSLGEIYANTFRIAEAQAAFDAAVKAFPSQAALYRRNETIFFFRAANPDAQLAAAEQAIALDPSRAMLYYFKAQALVSKATIDPKTQKMVLPPGCAEAYQKYLQLEPNGQLAPDAKGVLASAGLPIKAK